MDASLPALPGERCWTRSGPPSGYERLCSSVDSSRHQSHSITLIYSGKPKISRCYHSDILHFIKSGLGAKRLKHTCSVRTDTSCGGESSLLCARLQRMWGGWLERVSRATPADLGRSLTGAHPPALCVTSIAANAAAAVSLVSFHRWGNMATPAAVNPSGKILSLSVCAFKWRRDLTVIF